MKIYSSKKVALNNIPKGNYKSQPYCNGKYKTSIKKIDNPSKDVKAIYKSYRKDNFGSYVKLNCLKRI